MPDSTRDLMAAFEARMADLSMTQQDLADKIGMQQAHISKLLLGKVADPRWSTIQRICDALGVRVQFVTPAPRRSR